MVRSRGTAALVALLSLAGCAQPATPAGPAPTTATAEPLRVSLCDDPGDLVAWMRAEDLAVDEARCSADPTDTRPLRAYGKWTFPPAGRGTPHVESVEVAVFADRGRDGGSAFEDLKAAYPPHEQRTVAGHYAKVANSRGRTLIALPELADPLDITITTAMTGATDVEYARIRATHLGALEQLVAALVRT